MVGMASVMEGLNELRKSVRESWVMSPNDEVIIGGGDDCPKEEEDASDAPLPD